MTKKIHERALKIRNEEQEQAAQQSESYTAMLSHEMRTPLDSAIFLINLIMKIKEITELRGVLKKLQLIEGMLILIRTFTDDLLDMQKLMTGNFTFLEEVFEPLEVIGQAINIFRSKVANTIDLNLTVHEKLPLPYS